MADLSDVITALVNLAEIAVYPNGLSSPSVSGTDVVVFGGWPIPANLDADLTVGKSNVSIYATTMERPTTRFPTDWLQSTINPETITLTITGTTILTVGGTVTTPQTCMVIVNHTAYAYEVQEDDTLDTIAAGIADLIPSAVAVGPVVTISNSYSLIARISVPGIGIRELKRQERVFMISVWSPNDTIRTSLISAIDILFASTERFALPDNFYARLKYHSSPITDMMEKSKLYRRDLLYTVEYATTQTEIEYTIAQSAIDGLEVGPTGIVIP